MGSKTGWIVFIIFIIIFIVYLGLPKKDIGVIESTKEEIEVKPRKARIYTIEPDIINPEHYSTDSHFVKVYIRNKNVIEYALYEEEWTNDYPIIYSGDYEPWTIGKYIDEVTLKGLWYNKMHYSPHLIDSIKLNSKTTYIKSGKVRWW